jgi:copper chaperone CopZ
MEIVKFRTNIKCGGCVATVTPFLDQESNIEDWKVDTGSPDKVLTVSGRDLDPQRIKNLLKEAGFKADILQVAGIGGEDL